MVKDLLEKELKKMKEEKERCSQLYSDWKDDKYNCGANKFIWGITNEEKIAESFEDLTILMVYYNRDTKQYFLQLDMGMIKDIDKLRLLMLMWLCDMNEIEGEKTKLTEVNYEDYNDGISFRAPTLNQLYTQFEIFSYGVSEKIRRLK